MASFESDLLDLNVLLCISHCCDFSSPHENVLDKIMSFGLAHFKVIPHLYN